MAAQAKDINMSSDDCIGPLYQHVSGNSMVHGHQHGFKQWQRSQYMAFGGNINMVPCYSRAMDPNRALGNNTSHSHQHGLQKQPRLWTLM